MIVNIMDGLLGNRGSWRGTGLQVSKENLGQKPVRYWTISDAFLNR